LRMEQEPKPTFPHGADQPRLYMENPEASDAMKVEHQLRYHLAKLFALGRRVVDIGFGCGYGSEMLTAVADQVVGVDNSREALEHVKVKHVQPNLRFMEGDALKLTAVLAEREFDLAVAFELMEHLPDPARFLKEVRRVLKPGGMLLLSVPHFHKTGRQERTWGANPHHLWTWECNGLERLLNSVFPHVTVMIQYRTGFFLTAPAGTSWIAFCQKGVQP